MRWVCRLIDHHFGLKQLYFLSVDDSAFSIVRCQVLLKSLYLFTATWKQMVAHEIGYFMLE